MHGAVAVFVFASARPWVLHNISERVLAISMFSNVRYLIRNVFLQCKRAQTREKK